MLLCLLLLAPLCRAQWPDIPPLTVREMTAEMSIGFNRRTSLLFGTAQTVIGGTGSVNAPLFYMECGRVECAPTGPEDYVAVVEESSLGALLPELAAAFTSVGSSFDPIPSAVIALPGDPATPFSPASRTPFLSYLPYLDNDPWNAQGLDLLSLRLPCAVFLATEERATGLRERGEQNRQRGLKGVALYEATISLDTLMDIDSNSPKCINAQTCVPLGGYSTWATMPPMAPIATEEREQIFVFSHWDALGLFRSETKGVHSGISGLIAMLVAADILSANGRGETYAKDLIFVSLSGDAIGLTASRRMLFDLTRKALHTEGLDLTRAAAFIEVGMLGSHPGEFRNATLYVHKSITTAADSDPFDALLEAGKNDWAASVLPTSKSNLPPGSMLMWHKMGPEVPAVVLTDYDTTFKNPYFWSHKDDGKNGFSSSALAASAVTLAHALHDLAARPTTPQLSFKEVDVQRMTDELLECFAGEQAFACELFRSLTVNYTSATSGYVGVLTELPSDIQQLDRGDGRALLKSDTDRFIWEFLANRTFVRQPHDVSVDGELVGCNHKASCDVGEVCMHMKPDDQGILRGKCVAATVMFAPSYSTHLSYATCGADETDCTPGPWTVDNTDALQFEKTWDLPADDMWTETYNSPVRVTLSMRQSPLMVGIVFAVGGAATSICLAAVLLLLRAFHSRQAQQ